MLDKITSNRGAIANKGYLSGYQKLGITTSVNQVSQVALVLLGQLAVLHEDSDRDEPYDCTRVDQLSQQLPQRTPPNHHEQRSQHSHKQP